MAEAVIVSTARTPLCKSWRGALNNTHGAKMGGHVVHAALERAKLEPREGCSQIGLPSLFIAFQNGSNSGLSSGLPATLV